jgi:hypothetical protein
MLLPKMILQSSWLCGQQLPPNSLKNLAYVQYLHKPTPTKHQQNTSIVTINPTFVLLTNQALDIICPIILNQPLSQRIHHGPLCVTDRLPLYL